jgi:catechol 2,3-dioxygenase-like lactoylglutathione lyase family enzyme
MTRTPLLCLLGLAFSLSMSAAPYDHIHLAAPDSAEAAQWYIKHFGGKPTGFRGVVGPDVPIDRVYYGDIAVIFSKREPGAGSVGSGVDHIGFSLPNVAELVAAVVADGGSKLGDLREFQGMTLGFVVDPWGTKIEIIDDPGLRGVHHIHLSSADPEAALNWYANAFGGTRDKFANTLPAVNYGNVWLLARKSDEAIAPTQGRSLDHLGWKVPNLDAAATELRGKDVKFSLEPRDFRGILISMVVGPDNVRIEVLQP